MTLIMKLSKHNNANSNNNDINKDSNQNSNNSNIKYFKTKGLVGPTSQ